MSDVFKSFSVFYRHQLLTLRPFPFLRQNGEQIQQSSDDQLPQHEGQVARSRTRETEGRISARAYERIQLL